MRWIPAVGLVLLGAACIDGETDTTTGSPTDAPTDTPTDTPKPQPTEEYVALSGVITWFDASDADPPPPAQVCVSVHPVVGEVVGEALVAQVNPSGSYGVDVPVDPGTPGVFILFVDDASEPCGTIGEADPGDPGAVFSSATSLPALDSPNLAVEAGAVTAATAAALQQSASELDPPVQLLDTGFLFGVVEDARGNLLDGAEVVVGATLEAANAESVQYLGVDGSLGDGGGAYDTTQVDVSRFVRPTGPVQGVAGRKPGHVFELQPSHAPTTNPRHAAWFRLQATSSPPEE